MSALKKGVPIPSKQGIKQSADTIAKKVARLNKPIIQCDLEGNPIREFPSIKAAAEYLQRNYTSISQVLHGARKTAFGYK